MEQDSGYDVVIGHLRSKDFEVTRTEIHEKTSQSLKSKGWLPNLFRSIVSKAKEIRYLQEKVLPQLKQQLSDTKGIFKGKERKALTEQIQRTEKEIAESWIYCPMF